MTCVCVDSLQVYRGDKKVREVTGAIKDDLEALVAAECR